VRPYRADCKAAQWVPPAKKLAPRPVRLPIRDDSARITLRRVERADVLEVAFNVGYAAGLANRHHEDRNFSTGAEWLVWLDGHRVGQVEFKSCIAAENQRQQDLEAEALAKLEERRR
jgi:ribosome modulation factor